MPARVPHITLILALIITSITQAQTFSIDLDISSYPNVQFDLHRQFSSIQSVTFSCSGTMRAGLDYLGEPFSGQVVLWLRAESGYKVAYGPLAGASTYPTAEPFTGQSSFKSVINATWSFLLDGAGDGWFVIEPSLFLPEQQPLLHPSATIQSASLTIEADSASSITFRVDNNGPADFNNIQAAIDAAVDGDAIVLAPRTYRGQGNRDIDFKGKAITLRSENPNDPDVVASTIIDCNGTVSDPHRGFYFHNEEDAASAVYGLTITNGVQWKGGAVLCNHSSPTFTGCVFCRNEAYDDDTGGGAVFNENDSSPTFTDCLFTDNLAMPGASFGGAVRNGSGGPILRHCTFINNRAWSGGAVYCSRNSDPILTGCIFSHNKATWGYAVTCMGSNATVTHCTFSDNQTAYPYVGAVFYNGLGNPVIENCILWNDTSNEIAVYGVSGEEPIVRYCNIQGGWPGPGNIASDPHFADPCDGDYHLKSQAGRFYPNTGTWVIDDVTSPCIDTGNPMTPIGPEPFPNGGIINMGAYGGTSEASKSWFDAPPCETIIPGDINGDCKIDFLDFRILCLHWLEENG